MAPTLNRVVLIGRLVRPPELRYTASGTAVANFTLAVDRQRPNAQGEKEADFIRIIVWSKLGETCSNYLGKGRLVAVDGRLQTRSYQVDGQNRTAAEVIAEAVRFLDKAKDGGSGADAGEHGDEWTGGYAGPGDEMPPF